MSKLSEIISDYGSGVRTAHRQPGMSLFQAVQSVIRARLLYGIGPRLHSLFELYIQPEESWRDFLVDEPLKKVLRRVNNPRSREITKDKLKFYDHCLENEISTIPIVCAIDRRPDPVVLQSYHVTSVDDWCKKLDAGPTELFIKLIDGTSGIGAFSAKRSIDGVWTYCGKEGSAAALYAFTIERMANERGWIVQQRLRPHKELQPIMSPSGLGTLRVVTGLREGEPRILFAVLRMPVGKGSADNFLHGQSGNLIAAVDLETGVLSPGRVSKSRFWPLIHDVDFHPETGSEITGLALPYWEELRNLVVRAHSSFPDLMTVGWDVAIVDGGPIIVEANSTYDVDILQVAFKRGVRSDLNFLFSASKN